MPDNHYFARYIPLLIQVAVAIGLAAVMVLLSHLLGKHKWTRAKNAPYECGITPPATPSRVSASSSTW